ncbi:unnamed protein product, partial [Amoebophrya sp. A120]|eukprot:GSA120T00015862001.1
MQGRMVELLKTTPTQVVNQQPFQGLFYPENKSEADFLCENALPKAPSSLTAAAAARQQVEQQNDSVEKENHEDFLLCAQCLVDSKTPGPHGLAGWSQSCDEEFSTA